MVDRVDLNSKTINRREIVSKGCGILLGLTAASGANSLLSTSGNLPDFRDKFLTVNFLTPVSAQEPAGLGLTGESGIVADERGRSEAEIFTDRGIQLNVDSKFDDGVQVILSKSYDDKPKDPALQPYYEEPFDDLEAPEDISLINPAEASLRKRVWGTFFSPRTVYAADFIFAAWVPDADERWWPMVPPRTSRDKNHPELHAVGGAAHKYDVLIRDAYLDYIRRHDSIDGLWRSKGDAPTRAHAEFARSVTMEASPQSWWSWIGYCAPKARESVSVRPRFLLESRWYQYFPEAPASADRSKVVVKQVRLREDGSIIHINLDDLSGWAAMIGSCDVAIEVPVQTGLEWFTRTKEPIYANIPIGGGWWFWPIYGVSVDRSLVRTTNFGKAHRNFRADQIENVFIIRRAGDGKDSRYFPTTVGGQMTNEQIIGKGQWLYRSVWPAFIYHIIFDLPKPPIEDFLAWRQRLRHPDVRMVWGGF